MDDPFNIPTEVPAMTLKEVVLFPKVMLPLKIFEERYRKMLFDVLNTNRMFAVVCQRENNEADHQLQEPPFEVATVGLVRLSKKQKDGTSFVILQGLQRMRIRGIVQEHPYRVIKVELMESILDEPFNDIREKLVAQMIRNKDLGGEVTDEILSYLCPMQDDDAFVDLAAFTLCKHTIRKQAMLEVVRLRRRAKMLLDDLMRENNHLQISRHLNEEWGDESGDFNQN